MPKGTWTKAEDETLIWGLRHGKTFERIAIENLPSRTKEGCKTRWRNLQALRSPLVDPKLVDSVARRLRSGFQPLEKPTGVDAISIDHDPLVWTLLRYGIKHNTDLGMGKDAFMARAREYNLLGEAHA